MGLLIEWYIMDLTRLARLGAIVIVGSFGSLRASSLTKQQNVRYEISPFLHLLDSELKYRVQIFDLNRPDVF